MTKITRVYNATRGYYLKQKRAVQGVSNCVLAWVEFGVTVRDLTLAESIAARNQQTREPDSLPAAELPNCVFRFRDHEGYLHNEHMTAIAANQFAQLQP